MVSKTVDSNDTWGVHFVFWCMLLPVKLPCIVHASTRCLLSFSAKAPAILRQFFKLIYLHAWEMVWKIHNCLVMHQSWKRDKFISTFIHPCVHNGSYSSKLMLNELSCIRLKRDENEISILGASDKRYLDKFAAFFCKQQSWRARGRVDSKGHRGSCERERGDGGGGKKRKRSLLLPYLFFICMLVGLIWRLSPN